MVNTVGKNLYIYICLYFYVHKISKLKLLRLFPIILIILINDFQKFIIKMHFAFLQILFFFKKIYLVSIEFLENKKIHRSVLECYEILDGKFFKGLYFTYF